MPHHSGTGPSRVGKDGDAARDRIPPVDGNGLSRTRCREPHCPRTLEVFSLAKKTEGIAEPALSDARRGCTLTAPPTSRLGFSTHDGGRARHGRHRSRRPRTELVQAGAEIELKGESGRRTRTHEQHQSDPQARRAARRLDRGRLSVLWVWPDGARRGASLGNVMLLHRPPLSAASAAVRQSPTSRARVGGHLRRRRRTVRPLLLRPGTGARGADGGTKARVATMQRTRPT